MAIPAPRTLQVPPVLHGTPLWQAFSTLKGTTQIQVPLQGSTLSQLRTLEQVLYNGYPASQEQLAAATNLLNQALAENVPSQPSWVQQLFDGQREMMVEMKRGQEEMRIEMKRGQEEMRIEMKGVRAQLYQYQAIQKNRSLDVIRAPFVPVPLLASASGEVPNLPDGFNGSSLQTIAESTVPVINAVLALYDIDVPTGSTKEQKVRVLYRFFGGTETVEVPLAR